MSSRSPVSKRNALDWNTHEPRFRAMFRDWAAYRLTLLSRTAGERPASARRASRLDQLLPAAASAEQLASEWCLDHSPLASIKRAGYLSEVLRTGESTEHFLSRVIALMERELEMGKDLLAQVSETLRDPRRSTVHLGWRNLDLFESYEYYLQWFGIPSILELMVESSFYALYVAASPESRIILPDTRAELLRAIMVDDLNVRILSWRRFEEVVAHVYERLGCRTVITQFGPDWGADVLAWQPGPFGTESLIVVQTKLYAPDRRVDLAGVHALHGAVSHYNAHHGHLVTTVDLTAPARHFMTDEGYRIVDLPALRREIAEILL